MELGDGERWFNTDDLGRQDEEGYFWLTVRKKERVIRGGHNIDPQQIDELPLIAIGKLFKPALVMREIEDVLRVTASPALEQRLSGFGFRSECFER